MLSAVGRENFSHKREEIVAIVASSAAVCSSLKEPPAECPIIPCMKTVSGRLDWGARLVLAVLLVLSAAYATARDQSASSVTPARAGSQEKAAPSLLKLEPHAITLSNGKKFSLNLPPEFDITIAAQGLKRVRFMAKSPDGRIFVTDMYNRADNSRGTVYILEGWDGKSGSFARVVPYLQHLRNPNDVAFYADSAGQTWLYLPLTDKLERFRFHSGEESPSAPPEVLATYPDYGLNYRYGGWHLTRTVAFGGKETQGKLYVSVGTNMGADHLGDDAPADTMFAFVDNTTPQDEARNYGWPNCYFKAGKIFDDPGFSSSPQKADCSKVPTPFATFAAHSSPLGLEYFDSTAQSPALKNSFLVALHGSARKRLKRGYRVVRVTAHAQPQDFVTGFLQDGVIYGRPCDILNMGDDSFLLTDDYSGVIYFIYRKDRVPSH